MRKKILLGIVLAFLFQLAQAQNTAVTTVSGKITDEQQKPLEGATIALLSAADSTVSKTTISAADGSFILEQLRFGTYKIRISLTGYATYTGSAFSVSQSAPTHSLAVIALTPQVNALQNVTVSSQKPMIERKADRTVVNVDAMTSSTGSTALDVLEKSPGVSVDQNGNISFKGKNGVVIFIDDKPTYLSGTDLENYLRSLPSSTIDQIELMSNPPAKYDAAGGAGVINIRTKRTKIKGFNGSLNLAYGQGRYGRTNNSFNFNYRNNKFNSFGTVTFGTINNFNDLDINRYFKNPDGSRKYDFLQNTYIRPSGAAVTGKAGIDYYATDKTTFGIVLTGVTRNVSRKNDNASRIINAAYQLDSTIVANNNQENTFRNAGINLNYRHQYSKGGPELIADLDYINYKTANDQVFNNATHLPNGTVTNRDRLDGRLPAGINIYSGKIDYSHPFAGGTRLEGGAKTSYTETDNLADYLYTANNVTSPDYDKSNHFIYKETITAAYLNFNKEMKRFSVQLGLRFEHTISDGNQLGNVMKPDSSFKRTYSSLFPTAYLSYKLDSAGNNVLVLDYGKRINRPYYQDLNPFISPLDKFTYYVGNPFLQPAYTHNLQLSYSFKSLFTLSASYSETKDDTNETIEIVNGTYYSRPGNIGKTITKSISLSGGTDIAKWLSFNLYTEVTNIHTVSNFYTGTLNTKGTFVYVQPNLQFKLPKDWSLQLDGVYQSDVVSAQFISKARGRVNMGVSKKISPAITVKAAYNDMFYTQVNNGIINNLANTEANFRNLSDSRHFVFSFAYRFGKAISNQRRHNGSSSESEQNRVKN
ncbi:outer membrane beta-barrel protein [Sediminibacterium ginsengisoli]|uniref:Outer membrane receptor proteins, mostly Fe transport n=1 Tax=Sediminibacterium ginsengisoli TaxID=413434 RepID=A0A1T4RB54_9BACT|nr:outer membrane beta-barrel protein [Sediminibacterium ginsengisoli]SKA13165.1 Outer membrane receptor proteins, mostly Fe transport [Sediminibacterium ginsengisoli]